MASKVHRKRERQRERGATCDHVCICVPAVRSAHIRGHLISDSRGVWLCSSLNVPECDIHNGGRSHHAAHVTDRTFTPRPELRQPRQLIGVDLVMAPRAACSVGAALEAVEGDRAQAQREGVRGKITRRRELLADICHWAPHREVLDALGHADAPIDEYLPCPEDN